MNQITWSKAILVTILLSIGHLTMAQEFGGFSAAIWMNGNDSLNKFYNVYSSQERATEDNDKESWFTIPAHAINKSLGDDWTNKTIYFPNHNFGKYIANSNKINIKGAELKSFQGANDNVCSPRLHYRIFEKGTTAPDFSSFNIDTWNVGCNLIYGSSGEFADAIGKGPCIDRDKKWQRNDANIDITQRNEGIYTLEIYFRIRGGENNLTLCDDNKYINTDVYGNNNFKAQFTICPTISHKDTTNPTTCNGTDGVIRLNTNGIANGTYSNRFYYGNEADGTTFANVVVDNGVATISGLSANAYTKIRYWNPSLPDCGVIYTGTDVTLQDPPMPSTPAVSSITQPTCAIPTGTIVFTAKTTPVTYSVGGAYQLSPTFSSLPADSNYTLSIKSKECITYLPTNPVKINAVPSVPATPTASITHHPTCSLTTGNLAITAPLNVHYSIGSGFSTNLSFSFLSSNTTYTVQARHPLDFTCLSDTIQLFIKPLAIKPTGVVASASTPSCADPLATLTISAPIDTTLFRYSLDNVNFGKDTLFTSLSADSTYKIYVRHIVDFTCIDSSQTVTIPQIPNTPDKPTASATAQPSCLNSQKGAITITAPIGGNYQYSIGNKFQASPIFNSLPPDSTYDVTVRDINDTSCISGITPIVILPATGYPNHASLYVSQKPSCTDTLGTITVAAPHAPFYAYSIDGSVYQVDSIFGGLRADRTYTVYVRNTNDTSCVSTPKDIFLPALEVKPTPALGSITTQPTCAKTTGSVTLSSPIDIDYRYGIQGQYQDSAAFHLLAPSTTYSFTVMNTKDTTCVSDTLFLTINDLEIAPSIPTGDVTTQPTCTNQSGVITLTGPLGNFDYRIIGGNYQSNLIFSNLPQDSTYQLMARHQTDTTCKSTILSLSVDKVTETPSPANISIVSQPNCITTTGLIQINAPIGNYAYKLDNTPYQLTTSYNDLPANSSHTIRVRSTIDTTCISTTTAVSINPIPANPIADFIIQPEAKTEYFIKEEYILEDKSTSLSPISSWEWYIDNTLESSAQHYTKMFTTYKLTPVKLIITNTDGCVGEKEIMLDIKNFPDIFLPSGFSPNKDGKNDMFKVYGYIETMKLQIFNQWGIKVFESTSQDITWDGTFEGKEQPAGNYTYIFECKTKNGQEIKKPGVVTLVR